MRFWGADANTQTTALPFPLLTPLHQTAEQGRFSAHGGQCSGASRGLHTFLAFPPPPFLKTGETILHKFYLMQHIFSVCGSVVTRGSEP